MSVVSRPTSAPNDSPQLPTAHGADHPLVERATVVRQAFKRAPQLEAAARMMRPYTTAVSRVRS